MAELVRWSNLVAGAAQQASAMFESHDPFTGKPWAYGNVPPETE